jgi:alkaline phosphatase
MKKLFKIGLFFFVIFVLIAPNTWAKKDDEKHVCSRVENIIVLIPDGCDASIQTLARWFKLYDNDEEDNELMVDSMVTGAVKTYMANSVITGSAAAATAFSAGDKTTVRFLGVGPRYSDLLEGFAPTTDEYVPVATVLEAIKLKGKSVGLVATSRITHATPAAYASHIQDRGWDNDIMEHMVYENLDVVFGGGARHLIPKGETYTTTFGDSWGGKREDGENLLKVLTQERGYQFVDNKDDMMALTGGRVWGLFDDSHMDPDIDRDDLHPSQPSIAEMTGKAIELLSKNNKGFFLMVEGSQVDWAGHANDPVYMVTDFIAFDKAVKVAVDFAKKNPNTAVIAFPDHNTGALSIGHEQSDFPPKYTATKVADILAPIVDAQMTIQALLYKVPLPATYANVRDTFVTWLGSYYSDTYNMTDEHAQWIADTLNESGAYDGYYPIAEYVSKHMTAFGWTTHGHTGEDVPLWAYGQNRPVGLFDNTELAELIACRSNCNLDSLSEKLFIDAMDVFPEAVLDPVPSYAYNSDGDNIGFNNNPVIRIGEYQLPIGKDLLIRGNKTYRLMGVVTYVPGDNPGSETDGKVYIPIDAVRKIR